jgi:predicted aspartyl protease
VDYQYDRAFQPPAPVVQVQIGVPGAESPVDLIALLDSGSDISVLPAGVVERLYLRRADIVQVQGFNGEVEETPVHVVEFRLRGVSTWVGQAISWTEPYAILGRDALNRWRVLLDGPRQQVTIE